MQLRVVQMLREGLARLGKAIGAHEIKIDQLPEEAANRLRRDQIRGAIKEMRLFLGGTTVFAPVISMQAWGVGIDWLAILYTLTMWGFSWWLIYRWFITYQTDGSKKDMDSFVAETRLNAGLYCLGMVFFYPFVSGNEENHHLLYYGRQSCIGHGWLLPRAPRSLLVLGVPRRHHHASATIVRTLLE